MILTLFVVFTALSLILITIGLFRQEYGIMALAGFFFLFLLSFTLMGNDLQYQTGQTIDINYNYTGDQLTSEFREINNTYVYFDDTSSDFNTHRLGWMLAIISVMGFVAVLLGIRGDLRARQI